MDDSEVNRQKVSALRAGKVAAWVWIALAVLPILAILACCGLCGAGGLFGAVTGVEVSPSPGLTP